MNLLDSGLESTDGKLCRRCGGRGKLFGFWRIPVGVGTAVVCFSIDHWVVTHFWEFVDTFLGPPSGFAALSIIVVLAAPFIGVYALVWGFREGFGSVCPGCDGSGVEKAWKGEETE